MISTQCKATEKMIAISVRDEIYESWEAITFGRLSSGNSNTCSVGEQFITVTKVRSDIYQRYSSRWVRKNSQTAQVGMRFCAHYLAAYQWEKQCNLCTTPYTPEPLNQKRKKVLVMPRLWVKTILTFCHEESCVFCIVPVWSYIVKCCMGNLWVLNCL